MANQETSRELEALIAYLQQRLEDMQQYNANFDALFMDSMQGAER